MPVQRYRPILVIVTWCPVFFFDYASLFSPFLTEIIPTLRSNIFAQCVVSTVAKIYRQTSTKAVSAALQPSSTRAFQPNSCVLWLEVLSAKAFGLERAPAGPTLAPPL